MLLFAAMLLASPGAKAKAPADGVTVLGNTMSIEVAFGGDSEEAQRIFYGILEEIGVTLDEWHVTEADTKPRTARRYKLRGSVNATSVFAWMDVETNKQHEAGEGRWKWGMWWEEPPQNAPNERRVLALIRKRLEERLPKPDPNTPPPE